MVRLRWGFKKQALEIATEIRAELSVSPAAPLDPLILAAHLEVPVIPLSDFSGDAPFAVTLFGRHDKDAFSAVTVLRGHRRLIVYNDAHVPGREAATCVTNFPMQYYCIAQRLP